MEPVNDPAKLAAHVADIIRDRALLWQQWTWYAPGSSQHEEVPASDFYDEWMVPVSSIRETLMNTTDCCGSTACVAGWTAILAAPEGSAISENGMLRLYSDGEFTHLASYARAQLNLTLPQTNWLFEGHRTVTEVLWALDNIAADKEWDVPDGTGN